MIHESKTFFSVYGLGKWLCLSVFGIMVWEIELMSLVIVCNQLRKIVRRCNLDVHYRLEGGGVSISFRK